MAHVVLILTELEAAALDLAAGNTMDWPDAVEAVLGSGRDRAAAYRAYHKLVRARHTPPSDRPKVCRPKKRRVAS